MRALWMGLVALAAYGLYFLGGGVGFASVLALPLIAIAADLAFQRARFEHLRFPEGALATGLFLALLLPPIVPLVGAGTVTVAAITIKHTLRYRGRPVFNPAATGVVLGALMFGMAPAWWGSIDVYLLVGVGALVLARTWRDWRLPVSFLVAYAFLSSFQRWIVVLATGSMIVPRVLLLQAVDPAVLFFALLMVPEPRSAPSDRRAQPVYAAIVAAGAALLPLVLPTLAVFVALFAGNLFALGLRHHASTASVPSTGRDETRSRRARRDTGASSARPSGARWSTGRRASAGILVLLVALWIAAASYSPTTTPSTVLAGPIGGSGGGGSGIGGGGSSGVVSSVCQQDNQSISTSTLSSLHKALGPSVILSYSSRTGVVTFYDPVNAVTVTETDMYEDFGYAEFNGDDYASAGCVP
ncbi:MAG: RnfABCDGE type electron transport complex subunit D [Thermoplasmata archaeon]